MDSDDAMTALVEAFLYRKSYACEWGSSHTSAVIPHMAFLYSPEQMWLVAEWSVMEDLCVMSLGSWGYYSFWALHYHLLSHLGFHVRYTIEKTIHLRYLDRDPSYIWDVNRQRIFSVSTHFPEALDGYPLTYRETIPLGREEVPYGF